MKYSLAPAQGQIDDAAVDALAIAMKAKLAKKRARCFYGWDHTESVFLSDRLLESVDKGDPVDAANFCAFIYHNGAAISPTAGGLDGQARRLKRKLGDQ